MKRWVLVGAGALATVLAACASGPSVAPPFQQPPFNAPITKATLAVEAHDYLQPDEKIAGATVEIRDRDAHGSPIIATLTTNADGYASVEQVNGRQYDITVTKDGYTPGTASAFLTGNNQIPIALHKRPPPYVAATRPLVGPLRVDGKLFRDDTGYRRVLFNSWFTALRVLRDNPAEFTRQLDAIAAAGYQGSRVFLAVGGWSDFWDNHEVVPIAFTKWFYTGNFLRTDRLAHRLEAWPNYDELYRTLLREYKKRGLRLHVTTGDMQIIVEGDLAKELALHRRLARIAAEEGGLEVIALAEATNEFPLNRYDSQGPQSIAQMGRILAIWRAAIPGVLTAQGAIPQNEEPDSLQLASTHGEVCAVHVTRSPVGVALKRTLGLVYWEGDYRAFGKPFWQGEPAGDGQDSFDRLDDRDALTALYALHALTGQASTQFSGPSVRSKVPLDSVWSFAALPRLLAVIPEDVATWDRSTAGRGAILYWSKGNAFQTVTFTEWDPTPPRPVAEWTLYAGDRVEHGTGTPPKRTGLVVGRFR